MSYYLHKLTALAVKNFTKQGRYSDGGNLYLQVKVSPSGRISKSWIFRVQRNGKDQLIGLGSLKTISLAEARVKALEYRKLLCDGIHPLEHKRQHKLQSQLAQDKQKTFIECATQYIEDHKAGWKNEKHAKQWTATLQTYAYPHIGKMGVANITTNHILKILRPIWSAKTETAFRIRGRIENILDWAKVQGFRQGDNPACWKGNLEVILPARRKVQKVVHHPAMPYQDVPAFMKELHTKDGMSYKALEFAILNASRSAEIRLATWKEINFKEKLWIIPAQRMKKGKEHRVPLTDSALEILKSLEGYQLSEEARKDLFIFPAIKKNTPLSDMSMSKALKVMGQGAYTQHGFRSSFRDWAAEVVQYPREVIEHAIAHKLKDEAEAAYQRGDLLVKRRALIEDWSQYCYQNSKAQTE